MLEKIKNCYKVDEIESARIANKRTVAYGK